MITVEKAAIEDFRALSGELLRLLNDKNSQLYRENVAKFGIPDEYVRKAFSEETLLEAATSGKAVSYVAREQTRIVGFAQIVLQDPDITELDRIVVFPEYARKGIGTALLTRIVKDQQEKGTNVITVKTGREEMRARRFYEKNGFKPVSPVSETTVEAPWGKIDLVVYELKL